MLQVIADIDSYPQWISEYKEAEVQERGADGYPKTECDSLMDAGVIKDTMVMSYQWPADHKSLSWSWSPALCSPRPWKAHIAWRPRIWNRRHLRTLR